MIDVEKDFFMSTGYYTRANCEMCLLGTRKKKPKRINRDVRKLIVSPRREHSRKPEQAYTRIERLFDGPYLEMFSRSSRDNWQSWGNQTGLFDQGHVETRRLPSDMTKSVELTNSSEISC
jgi:N6-adenosine-specific RNA methylase IME4